MWDEQCQKLARVSAVAEALTLRTIEAGVFGLVVDTYEVARQGVQAWASQGATNTAAIADELRLNAVAYETTEIDVTATVEGAY